MAIEFESKQNEVSINENSGLSNNSVDIGKRIDILEHPQVFEHHEVDIAKRVQPEKISELTDSLKTVLVEKGMSPGILNQCEVVDGKVCINSNNSELEGKKHPETGVTFERKIVDLDGIRIEGVFPKFDAKFTAELPKEMYKASDSAQFNECNQQLKAAIADNPSLKEQFNDKQIAQIEMGMKPAGYTWHHNEVSGRMELVDTKKHLATGHIGGRAIWGGGTAMRGGDENVK